MIKFYVDKLLNDLLNDTDDADSYELLQAYLGGYPIETLIPLLESNNENTLEEAIWIVSELSCKASYLLEYIIPLVHHSNFKINYFAMDSILLGTLEIENCKNFVYVIKELDNADESIRTHAMNLICSAENIQLKASVNYLSETTSTSKTHIEGLSNLLGCGSMLEIEILFMLDSNNPLTRKYGVMIVFKLQKKYPKLINYVLGISDTDIEEFSERKFAPFVP